MFTQEDKDALTAMRLELEEEAREEDRRKTREKGRKIDQTELCYKQYSPPQINV